VIEKVLSKNEVPIRLTDERWTHIVEEHCELAGMRLEVLETVANPSRIIEGVKGELLAVQKIYTGKHLVVVYREIENDGFIITAFITSKTKSLNRRNQLWPK
jgi:hypothetical protein